MRITTDTKQRFSEIEFWALTSVFFISVLFFTWGGLGNPSLSGDNEPKELFADAGVQFGYYKHYFIPHIIRYITYFTCFMFFNFKLLPKLMEDDAPRKSIFALIGLGLVFILAINISTDIYLRAYLWRSLESDDKATSYVAQSNLIYTLWLSFAFITYSLAKYGGLLILSYFEAHPPKMAILQPKQLWILLLTLLIGLMLLFFVVPEVFFIWITVIPLLILFYNYCIFRLIPYVLTKKRSKLLYTLGVIIAGFISWSIIALAVSVSNNHEAALTSAFITSFFMVLVGAPALWYWYHYQQKRKANVQVLEQKLGQSTAQLDQLRAQINPHFLFNALNTVYGLAITEKAEQSADAIEKISEMMRFMLRENQEEKISLEKDLDYLKNYMGIQQMRLGSNPNFELSTEIPDTISPTLTIAPMLLIPFVENAFKHGISLQSHSYIRLGIQLEGNKLIFSLQNSTHDRIWLDDPEKNNHGIGMSNVKQRLALLYPERHLLSVKEDEHGYNVELTVLL